MAELLSPRDLEEEKPALTKRRQKELRRRRLLAFHRIGHRTILYSRRDVDAFLKSCRVESFADKKRGRQS